MEHNTFCFYFKPKYTFTNKLSKQLDASIFDQLKFLRTSYMKYLILSVIVSRTPNENLINCNTIAQVKILY